jgi:hypothetical protein
MAYFNHAFQKSFYVSELFDYTGALGTDGLLTTGQLSAFNAKTWAAVAWADLANDCCNLVLANGSLYQNDKIGPFAGGYLESNKSKEINPKYVSRLYSVTANGPQAMVVNVGSTPFTVAEETANCCKEFMCGETYYLRIDVKGSPAMRFLDRNSYLTVDAYTGCCPDGAIAPVAVDSTEVMIKWAEGIVNSPLISPFILPVVVAEDLSLWYAPGTDTTGYVAPAGYTIGGTWDNYVSPGHTADACAGLVLNGAYVDTKFGNCTFQVSDFYEKEPVRIYASEVDLNGDPCAFDGICVVDECLGLQANGLGESVAREMILSEGYRQSFFATDLRIREITQGNQILDVIDRTALYDGVYLQHNVPRFNNPTGTFDNDQYLLAFYSLNGTTLAADLYAALNGWLGACGSTCNSEEISAQTDCTALVPIAPAEVV